MSSPNHSTTIFSLKFNEKNDTFEIIPEAEAESSSSGFQNEFYNSVVSNIKQNNDVLPSQPSTATTTNEFLCVKCGKKYKYFAMLTNHQRTCEGRKETLHLCPSCNRKYKSTKAFNKHVIHCFQSNATPCLVDRTLCFCCAEPIQNAHIGHIGCPHCPKEFKLQKGLTRHVMLLHAATTKFKCELCDAQCSNNYILKLHRQSHNDEIDRLERDCPEYKCNKCDKFFIDKTAFEIHLSNHKREDIKPDVSYKCKVCQTNLPTLEAHNSHVCEDLRRTKYKCNLCGKNLSSKGFFQRHINTHKKYNELAASDADNMADASNNTDLNANLKQESSNVAIEDVAVVSPVQKRKEGTIKKSPINSNEVRILNGKNLYQSSDFEAINEIGTNSRPSATCEDETNESETESEINVETILKSINQNKITDIDFFPMDETTLKESVDCFLRIILDLELLKEFGWPHTPVEKVIVDILDHLECNPSSTRENSSMQLRENVKFLIEAVIDDASAIRDFVDLHVIDLVLREIIKYGMKGDKRH